MTRLGTERGIRSKIEAKLRADAMQRTIPFLFAIIFAVGFYYLRRSVPEPNSQVWSILVMAAILLVSIYFSFKRSAPISHNRTIEEMLMLVGLCLGKDYRLNIMEYTEYEDTADNVFIISHSYNMTDTFKYDRIFNLTTPGVGKAYIEGKTQVIKKEDILTEIDSFPVIIFSAPIYSNWSKKPVAVLNIDTNEELTEFDVQKIKNVAENAAYKIQGYLL